MRRVMWLCVDPLVTNGAFVVWGDTGMGGFDDPHRPRNCQFGGWENHGPKCGWYSIVKLRAEKGSDE